MVHINLQGRLGNQLFPWAAVRAIQLDTEEEHLPADVPQEVRQKHFQNYVWRVHYFAYALALSPDCRKLRSEYDPIIREHLRYIQSTGLPLTGALKIYIALLRCSFGLYAALVRVWQFKIRLTEGSQP